MKNRVTVGKLEELNITLRTELTLVNQIKVDLSSEMVEFIRWFCQESSVSMDEQAAQQIITSWQAAKAQLEIKKAGGVH
tara:strand:- start:80 stop:316 length:237 start_codon:yes stop_codon:yes gene_type:complete